ncbi:MAG TPA: PAS domain S-box protein, partial [bacterium]|nr:PAS domain S-box protein [bacterium]
ALARLFGYERPSELVGKNALDLTDAAGRERFLRPAGPEDTYEILGRRQDGASFPCQVRDREILYQGRPARVSTFLDLTRLREREQQILESEEKFRRLAEAATEGVGITLNGKILEVNQVLARMFGYEASEMVGRSALEFTAPESRDLLTRMMLSGTEAPYEATGLRKDGTPITLEISGRMVSFRGHAVRVAVFKDLTERKRLEAGRSKAERARQRSEARLRAVFNSGPQSMAVLDAQGRLEAFNRNAEEEMERVLGTRLEKDRFLADYLAEPLRGFFLENFRKALAGQTLLTEREVPGRDGRSHWFEFRYHPVLDGDGRATGVCVSTTCVDDRRRAQEALERSEERFRRLFEDSSVGMTLVAADKTFFHVNRAFCQMVGYGAQELRSLTFRDITDPADLEQNIRLGEGLPEGRGFTMQKRYRHKDGGVVWANITVTPIRDDQGRFLHSLGIIENITEQKRVEAGVRESEERYRRLVEFSPDAVFVYEGGKVLYANPAGLKLLGAREPGELVGRPLLSLVHPDDRASVEKRVDRIARRRGENPPLEQKFLRLDGQTLEVE